MLSVALSAGGITMTGGTVASTITVSGSGTFTLNDGFFVGTLTISGGTGTINADVNTFAGDIQWPAGSTGTLVLTTPAALSSTYAHARTRTH